MKGIGDGWERGKWRGGEEGIQMREGRRETAMYFPVIITRRSFPLIPPPGKAGLHTDVSFCCHWGVVHWRDCFDITKCVHWRVPVGILVVSDDCLQHKRKLTGGLYDT